MYTYTTPTITCTLTGVDFASVDYVRIAIKGKISSIIRVIPVADIDTEEGTAVVELTQEETTELGAGLCCRRDSDNRVRNERCRL